MNRREFLGAGAAMAVSAWVSTSRAATAKYKLKYAGNVSARDPLIVGVSHAAQLISDRSKGQIHIELYPNSVLGNDEEMLTQLRVGALDFFSMSGLLLANLVPAAGINGIGFAFSGPHQAWEVMDGKLGEYVRNEVKKAGILTLPKIFNGGFREITTSTHPIKTPNDLADFKIRVPVSPLWTSLFSMLGASPTGIGWAQVYTALQTHVVDGQESPLVSIESAKLFEVQKYCSLTRHMWDGYWILANPSSMGKLPESIRKIIEDGFADAALQERKDSSAENDSLQSKLAKQGLTFNDPSNGPFIKKLQDAGYYKHWEKKFGTQLWGLLESGLKKKLA